MLETSRGPEARQREEAMNFIGGPRSLFSSKSVWRKKVKITVTFGHGDEDRGAIEASRASRSDSSKIAKRSKHQRSRSGVIEASRSDVIEDRGAIEASQMISRRGVISC